MDKKIKSGKYLGTVIVRVGFEAQTKLKEIKTKTGMTNKEILSTAIDIVHKRLTETGVVQPNFIETIMKNHETEMDRITKKKSTNT